MVSCVGAPLKRRGLRVRTLLKMRLEGHSGFLELERCEVGEPGGPVDPDVLLSVTVKMANYSAEDQVWIASTDLSKFSENLNRLESCRQGEAILWGASTADLMLKFYSTDSVGHMAVVGYVGYGSKDFPLKLEFGFEFEPDCLKLILEFFRSLLVH